MTEPQRAQSAVHISYSMKVEEARSGRGEDKVLLRILGDRHIFAVVDGAGGTTGGLAAAKFLCDEIWACEKPPESWVDWLDDVDSKMALNGTAGLAAAVVIEIRRDGDAFGASVGDCEAWLFDYGDFDSLTHSQVRRPLLGSGSAVPVGFSMQLVPGRTLVASTDGLWKYMSRKLIAKAAGTESLDAATSALVEGVRLASGSFQDDVGIIVCRVISS